MIDRLLPRTENRYSGSNWSLGFLILATVMSTARGIVHLFAPEGGAYTIAGVGLDIVGGPNVVANFGQLGGQVNWSWIAPRQALTGLTSF